MVSVLISVALLAIATIFQIKFFLQTQSTRKVFKEIFPKNLDVALYAEKDEESNAIQIRIKDSFRASPVFLEIVYSINNYLVKNKGAAEFAILKDITDRNCDAVEEQIEATSPFPIYVGLCGTLIGIVFGVAVLGWGGGIDYLLSSSTPAPIEMAELQESVTTYEDAGATGIKDLLRGVAVAMITTFLGVILTILGSTSSKNAAKDNERRKNQFLSWMQGELLPQMNSSMVKTLDILQRNLTSFNADFAENSRNLNNVFSQINTTYEGQAEILRLVQGLHVDDIASANIRVLRELQQCTDRINILQEFLNQSNQYLASVQQLNGNLSDHYDRTRLIENMGEFFMNEIEQIDQRKAAISRSVGDIDLFMQNAIQELQQHASAQYQSLRDATAREHNEFLNAVEQQQAALSTRLTETAQLLEELRNLVDVKDSIAQLAEQSEQQQSAQISELQALNAAIARLASTNTRQENMFERLSRAIENMGVSVGDDAMTAPKKISTEKIVLMVVCMLTCFTIMGTCVFYLCNTLL